MQRYTHRRDALAIVRELPEIEKRVSSIDQALAAEERRFEPLLKQHGEKLDELSWDRAEVVKRRALAEELRSSLMKDATDPEILAGYKELRDERDRMHARRLEVEKLIEGLSARAVDAQHRRSLNITNKVDPLTVEELTNKLKDLHAERTKIVETDYPSMLRKIETYESEQLTAPFA